MPKDPSYPDEATESPVVRDVAGAEIPATVHRVRRDAADMSTEELLAVLVGPKHHAALASVCKQRSLRELAVTHRLDWHEAGLTASGIDRLEAVFEIAKRYGETEWRIGEPFRGSYDVYAHYRERLSAETREFFYGILLDNKHHKIRDLLLSVGSLTASIIHPRDIYSRVVRDSAASVIFVHNHPSGDPTPSAEDLEITRRLRQVGELLGVRVLDHVVIGRGRFVSFVDDGYW